MTERFRDLTKEQYERDLKALLDKPEGRRFFWRLLNDSDLFSASFTGDALTSAFNEGRRSVAQRLMGEMQALNRHAYADMVREAMNDISAREAAVEKEQTERAE